MVLAEIEAATKYPLEPGQNCFGRFGLVQGTLPEGTDLKVPLTAQMGARSARKAISIYGGVRGSPVKEISAILIFLMFGA